eukprot:UN33655
MIVPFRDSILTRLLQSYLEKDINECSMFFDVIKMNNSKSNVSTYDEQKRFELVQSLLGFICVESSLHCLSTCRNTNGKKLVKVIESDVVEPVNNRQTVSMSSGHILKPRITNNRDLYLDILEVVYFMSTTKNHEVLKPELVRPTRSVSNLTKTTPIKLNISPKRPPTSDPTRRVPNVKKTIPIKLSPKTNSVSDPTRSVSNLTKTTAIKHLHKSSKSEENVTKQLSPKQDKSPK